MITDNWMITVRTANHSDMDQAKIFIRRIFPKAMVSISDDDIVLLARYKKKIVGFAHIVDDGDRVILHGIGVDDSMRGQGLGTLLLQQILATIDEDIPILLKVKAMNPAVDLYARHGFFVKRFADDVLLLVKKPNS
jgi:N-acetylglutamate synthase-like GNAT family acetyltransferase